MHTSFLPVDLANGNALGKMVAFSGVIILPKFQFSSQNTSSGERTIISKVKKLHTRKRVELRQKCTPTNCKSNKQSDVILW